MSRTDLMHCSEGMVQRFMSQIVLCVQRAKAMNLATLQNHSRIPTPSRLEPKDLSSQLFGCTPPFISTASPSAVPSSSTPSSIREDQEKGPLSLHPLSLEESNRVTKAPIEPSPCLCESPCKVDYQSSNSEADPSQRLIKSPNDMLLQEIREINENLIETVVDVLDVEDISQTGCIKEPLLDAPTMEFNAMGMLIC
ncbi:Hypothetical predicted protein [Olea europaea subsp. europaea]|uniref:Uncharacterized protein n=1 Tax=Olea europaea subsp. europaea TaxID=158383 RepID=A0A8S0V6Y5_OLEEU|nr:Hypothetical predicted protein [Olea europaea subsp. europaea]